MPRSESAVADTAERTSPTTDLALIAFFAGLITVCAILPAIPVGAAGVPITLQTFAVMLAGACLGAKRGTLAVLLYLVVGFAGLPVFAQQTGGLGTFGKPSIGYLLAFPLAAFLCGLLVSQLAKRGKADNALLVFVCAMAGSIIFTHPMGIAGMHFRIPDFSWYDALRADMVFWFGDVVKNSFVAIVATAVHRAFPDLLGRR